MLQLFKRLVPLFLAFMTASSYAEEAKDPKKELPPLLYFQISPEIQTFYQSDDKKYGYIVVQVQLKLRGQGNFDLVEEHLPLLQDILTDFFNRQTKTVIQDLGQRKNLMNQATEKIAAAFIKEVGHKVIEEVLFTSYIYQ